MDFEIEKAGSLTRENNLESPPVLSQGVSPVPKSAGMKREGKEGRREERKKEGEVENGGIPGCRRRVREIRGSWVGCEAGTVGRRGG